LTGYRTVASPARENATLTALSTRLPRSSLWVLLWGFNRLARLLKLANFTLQILLGLIFGSGLPSFSKRAIPLSSNGLPGYGTGGDVGDGAVVEWNCEVGDMKGQESPIFVESNAQCWVKKKMGDKVN